jgi:hypothetical protein
MKSGLNLILDWWVLGKNGRKDKDREKGANPLWESGS